MDVDEGGGAAGLVSMDRFERSGACPGACPRNECLKFPLGLFCDRHVWPCERVLFSSRSLAWVSFGVVIGGMRAFKTPALAAFLNASGYIENLKNQY